MSTPDTDWLIQRTLQARTAEGRCFDMRVGIGFPQPEAPDWRCAVMLGPDLEAPAHLVGIDAWQAVQLAQQLVSDLLADFVARGGELAWEGAPLDPATLFVRSASAAPGA